MSRQSLISDPHLPFLELAWSPDLLAELFNRTGSAEPVSVSVDHVLYAPGTRCIIRCSLTPHDRPERPALHGLVSMAKDDRFRPTEPADGRSDHDADSTYVAEYGCLIERFPADWGLRTLRQAMTPSEIAPALAAAIGDTADRTTSWRDGEVLHYRPHRRCVLRYRPEATDLRTEQPDAVIVKVYPSVSKAQAAARRMATLRPAAALAGLDIPEPLLVDDRLDVLVMACASGSSVKQRLRAARTAQEAGDTIALAASALATLHTLQLEGGEPRTLASEIRRLRKRSAALSMVAPELAGAVNATADRVETLAEPHPIEIVSVGHGDFTLSQLLADGDRIAVVDFDRMAPADPALDVGNLMGKLHRDALEAPRLALHGLAETFLAQYEAAAGERKRLAERARLVQALTLARWAVRSFTPQRGHGGDALSYPFVLLEEANRCLPRA